MILMLEVWVRMDTTKSKIVQRKIRRAPFVTILIFLILGAIGISLGEPSRVLEQATQICLPCIGIG
jgi:hypothetical protein